MKLVVISAPEAVKNEHEILLSLFSLGLRYFHLRKPNSDADTIRSYIAKIPDKYHDRIIVHSHYGLAQQFNLQGIHLPERVRLESENVYKSYPKHLSTSFHQLEDVLTVFPYTYVFLSPVFDSVSKKGYSSEININEVDETLRLSRQTVIALGGITPDKINRLKTAGFAGAAVLGAIWDSISPVETFELFLERTAADL